MLFFAYLSCIKYFPEKLCGNNRSYAFLVRMTLVVRTFLFSRRKKKTMKRILALILVMLMVIGTFAACDQTNDSDSFDYDNVNGDERESIKSNKKPDKDTEKVVDEEIEEENDKYDDDDDEDEFSHIHSWSAWITVKSETCIEDGVEERTCWCDEKQERKINKTGHEYFSWYTEKKATCTADGLRYSICKECGEKSTEAIPAGHQLTSRYAKSATCTGVGWDTYVECKNCDYSTYTEISAKGHNYENGICTACSDVFGHKTLAFTSNGDGTCYVSGLGTCEETEIVIPAKSPRGDFVTGIGDEAFAGGTNIGSITIPARLTDISALGLTDCVGLEKIIIGDGNTKFSFADGLLIDKDSKTLVYALKDALIPTDESVSVIGKYAFSGRYTGTELEIPDNILEIGDYAFQECDDIVDITIGDNVTDIGAGTFYGCEKLKNIVVSKSVKKIGDDAFVDCNALEGVYIEDFASWCEISFAHNDSNPLYIAHKLYLNETLLTNLGFSESIASESIDSIGQYAFCGYTSIESLVIPSTVTNVGSYAFSECGELEFVEISSSSSVSTYAFYNTRVLSASVPADKLSAIPKTNVESVVITSGSSISSNAFYNCDTLISVELPDSILQIGTGAFYDCDLLSDVTIPSSVTKIGSRAFYSCDSLEYNEIGNARYLPVGEDDYYWLVDIGDDDTVTEYILTDGLKKIADGVFFYEDVARVVIPKSVISIGEKAFDTRDTVDLEYSGTRSEWKAVKIYKPDIYYEFTDYLIFEFQPVECSDGTVQPIRGYLGSQLTGNARLVYEGFRDIAIRTNPEPTVYFSLSDAVTYKELQLGFSSFLYDFPECFWVDLEWDGAYHSQTSYINYISPEYFFTGNNLDKARKELDDKVDYIIANMPVEMNTWDKTLYLHDALANSVVYSSNTYDQTAYGALIKNRAVCAGYTRSYLLLLLEAEIKAASVIGTAGGRHAWNAVWLDDETCVYTDVTWNDWGEKYNDAVGHYYFNMSYAEMHKNHTPTYESFWPSCDHDDQSYYDIKPDALPIIDENSSIEYMASLFTGEGSQKRFLHCFIAIDPNDWWDDKIREIYEALGGTGSLSGSWYHYGSGAEIYLILSGTYS